MTTNILRVGIIYGTRPELIKLAPVISALQTHPQCEPFVISTGQHTGMMAAAAKIFNFTPDIQLDVFDPSQTLNTLTSKLFAGLGQVFSDHPLDVILVQGDTASTVVGAQAAFYAGLPVVHLEAGLRSWDLSSPFPEEGNRRIVTAIASLHLAPTREGKRNLLKENVPAKDIVVTGNTVIDSLRHLASTQSNFDDDRLNDLVTSGREMVLVTCHRRENWEHIGSIAKAIRDIALAYPELTVVFTRHANRAIAEGMAPAFAQAGNIMVVDPLPYPEFIAILKASKVVLSDSGGVQEEGPALGTPVLCMRDSTERLAAVKAGGVKLVGTKRKKIVKAFHRLMDNGERYERMSHAKQPYGNGDAAEHAVDAMVMRFLHGED